MGVKLQKGRRGERCPKQIKGTREAPCRSRSLNTFRLQAPNLRAIASRVGQLEGKGKNGICSHFPVLISREKVLIMPETYCGRGEGRQELSCFLITSRTLVFMCRSDS